jgi:hypothetical protein
VQYFIFFYYAYILYRKTIGATDDNENDTDVMGGGESKSSDNPIILSGCAATALAAQVYGDALFTTAHSRFVLPVEEEDEKDAKDDAGTCLPRCLFAEVIFNAIRPILLSSL